MRRGLPAATSAARRTARVPSRAVPGIGGLRRPRVPRPEGPARPGRSGSGDLAGPSPLPRRRADLPPAPCGEPGRPGQDEGTGGGERAGGRHLAPSGARDHGGAAGRTLRWSSTIRPTSGTGNAITGSPWPRCASRRRPRTRRGARRSWTGSTSASRSEGKRYRLGPWGSPEQTRATGSGGPNSWVGLPALSRAGDGALVGRTAPRPSGTVRRAAPGRTDAPDLPGRRARRAGTDAALPHSTRPRLAPRRVHGAPRIGWHVVRFPVTRTGSPGIPLPGRGPAVRVPRGRGPLRPRRVFRGRLRHRRPREGAAETRPPASTAPEAPDVVLVNCPVWDYRMPPIGLGTIASFLRANGVRVRIVDFNIEAFHAVTEDLRFLWHGSTRRDGTRRSSPTSRSRSWNT